MGVCTTSHRKTPGRLVQVLNLCTVGSADRLIKELRLVSVDFLIIDCSWFPFCLLYSFCFQILLYFIFHDFQLRSIKITHITIFVSKSAPTHMCTWASELKPDSVSTSMCYIVLYTVYHCCIYMFLTTQIMYTII